MEKHDQEKKHKEEDHRKKMAKLDMEKEEERKRLGQKSRHEKTMQQDQRVHQQEIDKIDLDDEKQNRAMKEFSGTIPQSYNTSTTYAVNIGGDGKCEASFRLIYYASHRQGFRLEVNHKDDNNILLHTWMSPDISLYNNEDRSESYNYTIDRRRARKITKIDVCYR